MPDAATPTLSPADVRREIRDRLLAADGDRVAAIYLFGSRAKGTARPRSDWDVAVVMREPVGVWEDEDLRLGALFYGLPFAVDLHVFGEQEFAADHDLPGTLPSIILLRHELLYESAVGAAW